VLVKDINPGPGDSSARNFVEFEEKLFFSASDGMNGPELWMTNGTAAGTLLVKDINLGSGSSTPDFFEEFGGKLFFSASDDAIGRELWMSDGTAAGTVLVKDIRPGLAGSFPVELTEFGGNLFFRAFDGTTGNELWVLLGDSDGDGVSDDDDLCDGTVLPDVPTRGLSGARFAAQVDGTFDSGLDMFDGRYTLADTAGCSGTQIIEERNLGHGHTRFGISKGVLEQWIASVNGS